MNWFRKWWFSSVCIGIGIGHALGWLQLEWPTLAVIALAGTPVIIPVLARYIAAIKKTEKGWEFLFREDILGLPSEQIERVIEIQAKQIEQPRAEKPLDKYSQHAKRILATLWKYQKEQFGEDDLRRWGFGVGRLAPDFVTFSTGRDELAFDRLIYPDPRGMVYLTNEGVEFCKKNRKEVELLDVYYNHFVAAE